MSVTVTLEPPFALPPKMLTTTTSPPAVRSLSFSSRAVTTIEVSVPATPAGTSAVVFAGSALPAPTALA